MSTKPAPFAALQPPKAEENPAKADKRTTNFFSFPLHTNAEQQHLGYFQNH